MACSIYLLYVYWRINGGPQMNKIKLPPSGVSDFIISY